MYRRILFGVDAAGLAEQALPVVSTLARASGAEVIALMVHAPERDPEPAERRLREVVRRLSGAGVGARSELRAGPGSDPAGQIVAAARDFGADLVALGSHGRGHLGCLLLGSVSHQVATRLDLPLLLVHGRADGAQPRQPATIRRVLVAVDDSRRSRAAVAAAGELAAQHGAAVLAVHAREIAAVAGEFVPVEAFRSGEDLLAGVAGHLAAGGRDVETRLLEGDQPVSARIAAAAEAWEADVIVLGSRRLTDLGGLLLGSVGHDLVRRTNRPILLAGQPASG